MSVNKHEIKIVGIGNMSKAKTYIYRPVINRSRKRTSVYIIINCNYSYGQVERRKIG